MNKTALRLICLILTLVPIKGLGQSNIKKAFDAIIQCPDTDVTASHSLEKDPETNVKSGHDDIYWFVLPANKKDLVKKALASFDRDIEQAYSVKSGKNTGSASSILLHTEDTGYSGISIDDPGCEYMYALFLPSQSEDPDGKYRYAYCMNYMEEDGQIRGKLVINYATTLKYRQSCEQ